MEKYIRYWCRHFVLKILLLQPLPDDVNGEFFSQIPRKDNASYT